MKLQKEDAGQVSLSVSTEQVKRIYVGLFCRLQTGGCMSFEEIDADDMLLTLQTYLQKQARKEGVDCTDHAQWEAFLGIKHPATCPARAPERHGAGPHASSE